MRFAFDMTRKRSYSQEVAMKLQSMIALMSVLALAGCRHGIFEPDFIPPSAPRGVYTSTGDNFIEIFWNENPESDLAGYNIYVASTYQGPYELIGSSRHAYYLDEGARNGNKYYYAITAYDYDGNESSLSRDVVYDIPRPEGYDVLLGDYYLAPDFAGYDFSEYSIVPYDDKYADMYYEYYNGEYYMDLRSDSDIKDMGPTNSLLDVTTAPTSGWSTTHDAVLRVGHTYVVWTWDDHYAKFWVTSLSPSRVTFDWAYQLVKSTPLLKRGAGERQPASATQISRERGLALPTK